MKYVWLIDFDDTLASGPVTWGYQRAIPKLIQTYDLPVSDEILHQSLMIAQEKASQSTDLLPILDEFFELMRWPRELQDVLLRDIMENYRPELFEDAWSFLAALRKAQQTIIILSNNPRTPVHARDLGLTEIVDQVLIPALLPGAGLKPERSLWDRLVEQFPVVTQECAVVVGDDPWSDLAFATTCNVRAWLVDRHNRFVDLPLTANSQRVSSLQEIEIF